MPQPQAAPVYRAPMQRHRVKSYFCGEHTVEVVTHPDAEWFKTVEGTHLALLDDGSIALSDGFFPQQDVSAIHIEGATPRLAAYLDRVDGAFHWQTVQAWDALFTLFTGDYATTPLDRVAARALLEASPDWAALRDAMGNDPFLV